MWLYLHLSKLRTHQNFPRILHFALTFKRVIFLATAWKAQETVYSFHELGKSIWVLTDGIVEYVRVNGVEKADGSNERFLSKPWVRSGVEIGVKHICINIFKL